MIYFYKDLYIYIYTGKHGAKRINQPKAHTKEGRQCC